MANVQFLFIIEDSDLDIFLFAIYFSYLLTL